MPLKVQRTVQPDALETAFLNVNDCCGHRIGVVERVYYCLLWLRARSCAPWLGSAWELHHTPGIYRDCRRLYLPSHRVKTKDTGDNYCAGRVNSFGWNVFRGVTAPSRQAVDSAYL